MMDLIINLLALTLVGFIIWWFWLARFNVQQMSSKPPIEIIVENGMYTPAYIEVPQGERVILNFLRKDPGPCAEKVLFNDLNISLELPLEQKKELIIPPLSVGEYSFSCQMQMYRGSLVVK